jgi:hypothetical protein
MSGRYVTESSDGYWLGRLSMAVAISIERPHPVAKDTLEEFLKSDASSMTLVSMIREELKKK